MTPEQDKLSHYLLTTIAIAVVCFFTGFFVGAFSIGEPIVHEKQVEVVSE